MVEKLTQSTRGSRAAGLLPIHIIHCLIHPDPSSEAEVYPSRTRTNEIRNEDLDKRNVNQDAEEAEQSHHVWGEPQRKKLDKGIPL